MAAASRFTERHFTAWVGRRADRATASLLDRELRLPGGRRRVAGRVASGGHQEVAVAREAAPLQLPVEGELVRADLAGPLDRAGQRQVALLALAVRLGPRLALAVHLPARAAPLDLEGHLRRLRKLKAHLRRLLELERARLHK